MNVTSPTVEPKNHFEARPLFLTACFVLLAAFLLPGAIRDHRIAQWSILILSCLATFAGWFLGFAHRQANSKWRQIVVFATAVYLTASIPVFFLEFSQVKWFMRGPHWASMYARPWVHWGSLIIPLSVVGSLFGHGRVRIALLGASILLLILWQSMSRWVF